MASAARRLARLDRMAFVVALAALAGAIIVAGRANIIADSVDYYANLQRLSPAGGVPIVGNLHSAAQRSPGYSLAALFPHVLLLWVVEPIVGTARVDTPGPPPPAGPPSGWQSHPPRNSRRRAGPAIPPGIGLIPPRPLPLWQVPFKDFRVPVENSWFQWKVVLALALTSYGFLFTGLFAIASSLRRAYPAFPGYSLIVALLVTSPMLLWNIVATPLYATLTAFGAAALFACFLLRADVTGQRTDQVAAGAWLGLLVLTRLETAVLAAVLGILLLRRQRALLVAMAAGASWAIVAWMGYNLRVFGSPLSVEILRGDINVVRLDSGYILQNLLHPSCGLLFWSPLVCLGLAGLLVSRRPLLRGLGISSVALIGVFLLRVPVMLQHIGGGPIDIGGLPAMPPPTAAAARELIRSDINRYATVLAPFAVLGTRDLTERVRMRWTAASAARRGKNGARMGIA